jgi:hypothetical protein
VNFRVRLATIGKVREEHHLGKSPEARNPPCATCGSGPAHQVPGTATRMDPGRAAAGRARFGGKVPCHPRDFSGMRACCGRTRQPGPPGGCRRLSPRAAPASGLADGSWQEGSGSVNRLLRPDSVRHMSVTTAAHGHTAAHHETRRQQQEGPRDGGTPAHGPYPQVVAGVGFEPT